MKNNNRYKEKSIKKNSIFNFFLTFANIIFPFISTPYVSRILKIEDIGLLNKGSAFSALFINLCSFGLAGYGARQIARVRLDEKERSKIFSSVLICHILTVLIGTIVYFSYVFIFTKENLQRTYLIYVFLLVINPITVEWFYQGMEDFGYIAIRSVLVKIISFVLLFIFVKKESDFYIYGLLLVGAQGLNSFYNIFHSRKYVSFTFRNLNLIKIFFSSKYFYLQTLVAVLYQNINQILLGKNQIELALYVRATTITSLIGITATSIENALKPRLENIYNSNSTLEYKEYINKASSLVFILVMPIALGMCCLSNELMYLFGGNQFISGGTVLSILSLQGMITCFSVFLNMIISTPAGKEKNTFYSNLVVAIVAGILNPFLILHYGAKGAAYTILIAEFLGSITHFILIKNQKLYLGWFNKSFFKYLISSIIMSFIVFYILKSFGNLYIRLVWGIIIGIIVYILSLLIFSIILKDKKEFNIIKQLLKRKI